MRIFFLFASLFLALSLPTHTHAQTQNEQLVKIRLLPEKGEIKPGDEIWIGTEQSIAEHWHTYWINPGDSGTPALIEWQLPDGFEISEIEWPTPEKLPYGPLLNYGYSGRALLLQKLTVPDTLPEGPVTLNADIELLVCKEECIPEYGTYSLTLNGPNAASENNSAYLQTALAKMPQPADWKADFNQDDENLTLTINAPAKITETINLTTLSFMPLEWGYIENAAPPQAFIKDGAIVLEQKRGDRNAGTGDELPGVLVFETMDGQSDSHKITADFRLPSAKSDSAQTQRAIGIIQALIFALLGGLILNLMPCVFPVLSIKALSLVKIAEKQPQLARAHGLAYTAGVISSFMLIAGILIGLKAGGAEIGWGFQLQNPWIVGALSYLLFVIGLNFIGFFEITTSFANVGGRFAQNNGLSGSFATGILATLVATPCTAPFMAGAIGFAFVQPPIVSLTVFFALGLGLALPYLLLSFVPALQKILPKPGAWMEVFKQFLAFPMFAAALWLLWVMAQQTGIMGVSSALFGAILIAFSIWLFKHIPAKPFWHYFSRGLAVVSLLLALLALPIKSIPQTDTDQNAVYSFGQAFSKETLETALKGDDPVFTEMTAAWCITCKVNHAVAININSTKELFARNNVTYMVGDWTNEDPAITKYLQNYRRNGVPLYVYYGPRDPVTKERPEPKVLPQVLTPGLIADAINGKS